MDKKTIMATVLVAVLAGLIGFFGGRYYEKNTFTKGMPSEAGEMPEGFTPGEGRGRPNGTTENLPTTDETTKSTVEETSVEE